MNRLFNQIALGRRLVQEWLLRRAGLRLKPAPIRVAVSRTGRRHGAFTMIEVAISLAVIGFALVAIIGILPFAMNVQKENRQETIVNQDASTFINAIRNGERGVDDLTNYVVSITNYAWSYAVNQPEVHGYTFAGSSTQPSYPLTNGFRIIGLLSTPRYDGFRSNYIVAYVRSLSGLASEKFPQTNADIRDFALAYRMIAEVMPATTNFYHWRGTNYTDPSIAGNTNEITIRSNAWMLARTVQTNFHDLRLTFRYPYVPGRSGRMERLMFRTQVSGRLTATNEPGFGTLGHRLFFFDPHSFAQVLP